MTSEEFRPNEVEDISELQLPEGWWNYTLKAQPMVALGMAPWLDKPEVKFLVQYMKELKNGDKGVGKVDDTAKENMQRVIEKLEHDML